MPDIFDIFASVREQRGFEKDIANLQRFQQTQRQLQNAEQRLAILRALPLAQRQAFQGQAPQFPAFMPFPQAQSRAGGELFGDFLLNQQQIAGRAAAAQPTAFKVVDQLVDDPNSPTKFSVEQFNQAGQSIGRRFATRKEVLQGVPEAAITKPTITKIEKDVIDLQSTLTELKAIEQQFDENFFTFRGKGKAFFTALAEKAEIPVGRAAKNFLSRKTKFFADSKRVFLKFRKFITGVAGGIEEFREIAKATIDPEKDSPTQFKAKFESMKNNAIRTSNLLLAIRNSGLEPNKTNIKAALSLTPLNNIPLQVGPNINLQTLGQLPTGEQQQITPLTATNPQTGQRIQSFDGGETWQPIQ